MGYTDDNIVSRNCLITVAVGNRIHFFSICRRKVLYRLVSAFEREILSLELRQTFYSRIRDAV